MSAAELESWNAETVPLSEDAMLKAPPTETYAIAAKFNMIDVPWMTRLLLFHPLDMPVLQYKEGKQDGPRVSVKFLPGHPFGSRQCGPQHHYRTMAIGKRPGSVELQSGFNFTGPSGSLLRDIAREQNYDSMLDWYITNVVRFMPPDGGKVLRPYHIADGMYLLMQEIAIIEPEYILLMGTEAVKAMFGRKASQDKMRSQAFFVPGLRGFGEVPAVFDQTKDTGPGMKVMSTVHPAAVCREVCLKPGLSKDIEKFKLLESGADVTPSAGKDCQYLYAKDAAAVETAVNAATMNSNGWLAIDCEWGNGRTPFVGQLRSIQFSWEPRKSCVVILREQGGAEAQAPSERLKILNMLRYLFSLPRTKIIGHNFRADAKWLASLGIPVIENLWLDTMLLDHVLNENAEHGLEACTIRYTDMGRYDYPLMKWLEEHKYSRKDKRRLGYMHIPDDIFLPYAAMDPDATIRCVAPMLQMLYRPENDGLPDLFFRIIMPTNVPLHEVEMTGVLADRKRLISLVWIYEEKKNEIQECIRGKLGDPEFNPRSGPQVQKLLFEQMGLSPFKTTEKPARIWADLKLKDPELLKSVNPAVDTETLEYLAPSDKTGVVAMIRDFKVIDQVTKNFLRLPDSVESEGDEDAVYSEGLVGFIDPDGRVRTTISQMSETGRHKSSDVNCQNWPKKQEAELARIMETAYV